MEIDVSEPPLENPVDLKLKLRRLAIFERVKAKLSASGNPMREDTGFLELVGYWTEGRVGLDEVIKGYRSTSAPSRHEGIADMVPSQPKIESDEADLLADLEEVIGMVDLSDIQKND